MATRYPRFRTKPLVLSILFSLSFVHVSAQSSRLTPHRITLSKGTSFNLNLPESFEIAVAVEGLKRVRFMALSPDKRIFVTDMYNLADNRRGAVYILDNFDEKTKRFKKVTQFMSGLRNPNSVAFYKDVDGTDWFYLALTDRLIRYRYEAGSLKPGGQPEVLATYPDYGLSYKYGGWHLTRTIVFGSNRKLYVSVGSSCNACEEKEDVRASIIEMDPDGKNKRHYASGLRNAVGMRWIDDKLFVTNMGADHLGLDKPDDTMGSIKNNTNYGWPYCYQSGSKVFVDQKLNPRGTKFDCQKSPPINVPLGGHTAPLGLEYFADGPTGLSKSFLVALHGSTNKRIARGYRVVRVGAGMKTTEDFITGFLQNGVVNGRPCDIFAFGDGFLLTDDNAGVIYYIFPK